MADNTLQFRWIVTIQGGLSVAFRDDPSIFVAGDLLWYPVEGNNKLSIAPDVLVARRPKGDRRSYLQWVEDNQAPEVVFDVEWAMYYFPTMLRKFEFYDHYGVGEYYLYDLDRHTLYGWQRVDGKLEEISDMKGWVSPRLGIRFEMVEGDFRIYGPDNKRFATYEELAAQREQAEQAAAQALQAAAQALQAAQRDREAVEKERQEKEVHQMRAAKLAAQLRAMGIEPEA